MKLPTGTLVRLPDVERSAAGDGGAPLDVVVGAVEVVHYDHHDQSRFQTYLNQKTCRIQTCHLR